MTEARCEGGIDIVPVAADDVPAVTGIELASFSDPWPASAFLALLGRDAVTFAMARREGRVVGYVVSYCAAGEAELANLAVSPDERRRGTGAALLGHAIHAALTRGALDMWLEVRASNSAALDLYARGGFTRVGVRRRYYRSPVEDALVLRRVLRE